MKIIPLSEGSFTIDKTKVFVPFNKETDELNDRARGSLLVEIQPFLIVTAHDVMLLDTGLGFRGVSDLQLYENLKAADYLPREVTKVLLSHLHKDHAGGITYLDAAGKRNLTFPKATYYVSKKEFNYAMEEGLPSYENQDFQFLLESGKLVLLEQDAGAITEEISYELSGGHSPFHTVFWIRDEVNTAFFGGDVAPQLQQMKSKFVAKYDSDGKRSMQLRANWWEKSQEEHWAMLFYHDIKSPMIQR